MTRATERRSGAFCSTGISTHTGSTRRLGRRKPETEMPARGPGQLKRRLARPGAQTARRRRLPPVRLHDGRGGAVSEGRPGSKRGRGRE